MWGRLGSCAFVIVVVPSRNSLRADDRNDARDRRYRGGRVSLERDEKRSKAHQEAHQRFPMPPGGERRAGLEALLGRLNDMFQDSHATGSGMGPALQAAYQLSVRCDLVSSSPLSVPC